MSANIAYVILMELVPTSALHLSSKSIGELVGKGVIGGVIVLHFVIYQMLPIRLCAVMFLHYF